MTAGALFCDAWQRRELAMVPAQRLKDRERLAGVGSTFHDWIPAAVLTANDSAPSTAAHA